MTSPEVGYLTLAPSLRIRLHKAASEHGDEYLLLPEDRPADWDLISPGPFHDAIRWHYERGATAKWIAEKFGAELKAVQAWILWTGGRLRATA